MVQGESEVERTGPLRPRFSNFVCASIMITFGHISVVFNIFA